MLHPTTANLYSFVDSLSPSGEYRLSNVSLEIPDHETAILTARLNGPAGSQVWARAWLWNEIDKTVAEAASPTMIAGTEVMLTVNLKRAAAPDHASMRIESAPMRTEHVVTIELPK